MGVSMKKVTISGHPGSGTSTLVEGLSKHFSWTSINGGQIFRNEAKERNMTLAQFGNLCYDDETVDLTLDEKLRTHILDNSTNIIESRLAGWWAYKLKSDCVRIWLNVSEQERARRVTIREGTTRDDAISANKARLLVDNERYQKGISSNTQCMKYIPVYTHTSLYLSLSLFRFCFLPTSFSMVQ